MKKIWLIVLFVLFSVSLMAQVTAIRDIQYTDDPSGDSPLKDQEVTITGIITVEPYAFGGSRYYVQDANGPWNGVLVYDSNNRHAAEGDSVVLTGTVDEYYGMTEIVDVSAFEVVAEMVWGIVPDVVTTGEIGTGGVNSEAYEGCLVQVQNVAITNPAVTNYGEWLVNDGSGDCMVDDTAPYYFVPANYDSCQSITGILSYAYSEFEIEPRLADDVVEAGKYTRIQRFQQVRYSALLKASEDAISDTSYMRRDTLNSRGIVTMPSGLSYAGDGIKFIFGEPEGGPWSAVLSYNPDSTAYPVLYEGDEIEMTGWIDEYQTDVANMTEFWITSPIEILSIGNDLPPVDTVATGDLRWPTTAEQWGNVIVAVKNALVTNNSLAYELFAVDDGSGAALVDDDSDSLATYYDTHTLPPLGSNAKSISGWVYHHYGSYADSSAYKLEPLYISNIVWGEKPPQLQGAGRDLAAPKSSEAVTVTVDIISTLNITNAKVYYQVEAGLAKATDYAEIAMTNTGGETWSAQIPAQQAGTFVSYYFEAEDSNGQSTMDPADPTNANYSYVVTDDAISIADIQYTPWTTANSPFEGFDVEITGIVTCDTATYHHYEAYAIQDAVGAWNGIFVFGTIPELTFGDEVKVTGTVTDYNPDWGFKWDNNTVILADAVELISSGNTMPEAATVQTGDLANGAATTESYESVLVKVENATLTRINAYDVSIDDGSGECLLDGDFMVAADQDPNPVIYFDASNDRIIIPGDTIHVGDQVGIISGILTYSFGTYKISLRSLADLGGTTGVRNAVTAKPLTFALNQNYPNPFNAGTCIHFSLAETRQVDLIVYNMLGQQVRHLIRHKEYNSGNHILYWDGKDNRGIIMPSGLYVCRIKAGDFMDYKKMTLLK